MEENSRLSPIELDETLWSPCFSFDKKLTSPLLTRGGPNLGLDNLVVDMDAPGGEFDVNQQLSCVNLDQRNYMEAI
ncbi:hypothetical protein QJS04_geneDACA011451 [Acorus gramineus]|uniref:Uncharacterized protein n=1 Tax=Acorus gramineus TaxID=55184 RepID=A0AAV9AJZ1_ACOGR|nr:hypothetical protein QJS04_geneDACA011451 [Acorus gramineus]